MSNSNSDISNSDILARVYNPTYPQVITIYPIMWKHEIGGNWFILAILNEVKNV